jgi:hypothetical protein
MCLAGLFVLSVASFATAVWAQEEGGPLLTGPEIVEGVIPSVASVLVGDGRGQLLGTGSAVVVKPDGVLVTAYHVVKSKPALQIRFKNGEVYDQVEIIAVDERRDVAVLRVPGVGLPAVAIGRAEELRVGETVYVISNPHMLDWTTAAGILSSVRQAEEIPGAGEGFRLLQFTAPISPGSSGGVLLDGRGKAVGIVVSSTRGQNNNFAVPLDSVLGLVRAQSGVVLDAARDLYLPRDLRNPPPPVVSDAEPGELVEEARGVYIRSRTRRFPVDTLAAQLLKHPGFRDLPLKIVRDERVADLIIEVDHRRGYWDFPFTVFDKKTSIVITSGNVIAWDGIRAAPRLAEKIVKGLRTNLTRIQPDLSRR